MINLLKKLLLSRQTEYLMINSQLKILEVSNGLKKFAEFPELAIPGEDIQSSFPELIGTEKILEEVINGKREIFEYEGVARSPENKSPLYINLSIIADLNPNLSEKNLIVLVEDVTENMVMQQKLIQSANESHLLLSALTASQDYINKIITYMADVLLVTTSSGVIKTVNHAAEILFDYQKEELLGKEISMIIPQEKLLHKARQKHLLLQGQVSQDVELICQNKSGEKIIVEFSCSVIQTDVEGVENFVYIGRDITERKKEEEEIRQALEQERDLREVRGRFFSMVTHEFGNPLNTVLLSSQLLRSYESEITEAEKNQYLLYIEESTQEMLELLEDVRFIGKADAGKLKYKPAPIDLIKVASHIVNSIRVTASNKHIINFTINKKNSQKSKSKSDKNEVQFFLMDEKLIRHILNNLLSNAIKYSPTGGQVDFQFTLDEQKAIFSIKDEGIGIPIENQKKLFESFYRASNVGKIAGTGLGLSIVKQCVELHSGKIDFSSEVGKGTTFIVEIPLERVYSN
ncbi:MAG: PAS domain-containing sensor histidine kinase [Okeania sp. SIO2F4]|uniref:sensor histidine kinase n=1 Tax=Okeania sp. SIO2F4 TaxID=2607790 RepID=UPI00142A2566|nr:PAS domain-containing sensor histidine kinase [Okeania sp. SIO2F4]NES03249.1 PAS domain-containing sensor histidine kinase [Okeania sp. SIO2F4]